MKKKTKRRIPADAADSHISSAAREFCQASKDDAFDLDERYWTAWTKRQFNEHIRKMQQDGKEQDYAYKYMNRKKILGPDYQEGSPEYNASSYARAIRRMNGTRNWTDIRMGRPCKADRDKEKKRQTELLTQESVHKFSPTNRSIDQPKNFVVTGQDAEVSDWPLDSKTAEITRFGYFQHSIPAGFVPKNDSHEIHTAQDGTRSYRLVGKLTAEVLKTDPAARHAREKFMVAEFAGKTVK